MKPEVFVSILALFVSALTWLSVRTGSAYQLYSGKIAQKAETYARLNAKAQLFIQLRGTYAKIHNNLPREKNADYEKYRNALREYWINAYNEWYVTTEICPKYRLWQDFFSEAIKDSINDPMLKKAFDEMNEEGFAFGTPELKSKFLNAIGYCE